MRKLAIIALSGITLSAIFLGAGAALEGQNLAGDFVGPFGGPRCADIPGATAASRTLAWDGSDHFGLAVRATANYAPGTDDRLHLAIRRCWRI